LIDLFNRRRTVRTDSQCLTTIQVDAAHAAAMKILETRYGANTSVLQ
jgi:hypothetical protein